MELPLTRSLPLNLKTALFSILFPILVAGAAHADDANSLVKTLCKIADANSTPGYTYAGKKTFNLNACLANASADGDSVYGYSLYFQQTGLQGYPDTVTCTFDRDMHIEDACFLRGSIADETFAETGILMP